MYCGATFVVFLLLIAKMHQWDGGESYGPRYLVPTLTFVTIPIALFHAPGRSPAARRIVGSLALAGVLVQLPGVLVDFNKAQLAFARVTVPPCTSFSDFGSKTSNSTRGGSPLGRSTRCRSAGRRFDFFESQNERTSEISAPQLGDSQRAVRAQR